MAYPTGSGSETLFRGSISGQSNDATAFRWDRTNATTGTETYVVPALHIITVVSIFINNIDNDAREFDLLINDGANDIYLINDQAIGGDATFILNDRLVLVAGDKLIFRASAGNLDAYCSFIDQDWS